MKKLVKPKKSEAPAVEWMPTMSPKGIYLWHLKKRKILLHGPRKATKSNSAQNKLLQHAFDNDGAVVGIIVKGKTGAVAAGVWTNFTGPYGLMAQSWIPSGLTAYASEPSISSDTKMRSFKITNRYFRSPGYVGFSEIQLHTLQHDNSVETVFKDTSFSALYLVEADRFRDRAVFTRLTEQLRGHIPFENRMIILDCNPPEEGEDHWIYRTFINNEKGEYVPSIDPDIIEIPFSIDDNPFISQAEKDEIYNSNKYDSNKLNRFYFGKWVKDTSVGVFSETFMPSVHIQGGADRVMVPSDNSFEMRCGWDPGDSSNHGFILAFKRAVAKKTVFDIIDEVMIVDKKLRLFDVVDRIEEKIKYWLAFCKKRVPDRDIHIKHWADPSALRFMAALQQGSTANEITNYTEGRIVLLPAPKGNGSIRHRLELVRRLLFEERIFVSARCIKTLEMLRFLKAGRDGEPIDEESDYEHAFAALSYMLASEVPQVIKEESQTDLPDLHIELFRPI